jgi:outer membrane protein OmpA-like peptidoglycan-associated protein
MPVRFDFGVKLPEGRLGGGQSSVVIELGEVLFEPGSAEINPRYATAIDGIATTVREHQGGRLTITATGDSESLAFRRAQAVQEALFGRLDPPVREHTSVDVVSRIEREQLLLALGDSVKLGNLLFDTDSATIRPRYGALIREIADAVERQHCGTLEVDGHADRRGSDAYNMNLAMRRAKAVSDAVSALLSPEAKARLRVKAVDPVRVAGADPR